MTTGSDLRPDIIASAAGVFARYGYDAATLDQIAEAVGMRKASLYHHVRSKEHLYREVHLALVHELLERTHGALEGLTQPADRLRAVFREALEIISTRPGNAVISVYAGELPTDSTWNEVHRARHDYDLLIRGVIEEGIASGVLRQSLPTEIVTLAMLGSINWTYRWLDPRGKFSPQSVADIFCDLFLRGIQNSEEAK